ncbi:MAG: serine hydrolase [Ferruginibacter sp.]
MKVLPVTALLIFACVFAGCGPSKKTSGSRGISSANENVVSMKNSNDDFFTTLFNNQSAQFDSILLNKKNWNVQVIYTQVNRNSQNEPRHFTTYSFNKNDEYFYPASTVKLPIALLALEKLNELKEKNINKYTTMLTEASYSGQSPVYNDPTTPDGRPTIAHYIKKLFMVSDNDAANRLYEFLGQQYLNNSLHNKGYNETQILHRLAIFLSEDENRHTNPVSFYDSAGKLLYKQPMLFNTTQYDVRHDSLGKAYYSNGKLVNKPMNFSKKNKVSLNSLHQMMISVVFPSKIKKSRRFNISDDDRNFVLKYMSQLPGESVFPSYDTYEYYDAYAKFIHYGSEKGTLPKHIRIFNKVGNAYGQLVDVAYVVDMENKIEYFVSAAITCNTDEILNDDKYDYNTIGFPFMKNLGKALYEYELKRTRKVKPDLSAFVFPYDK